MTKISTVDKQVVEKLEGLKVASSTKDLLQGLRQQERLDKVLLVLLDTSGSMAEMMETSSKIEVAWQVFHSQLVPNIGNWHYGIVGFNYEAYWIAHTLQSTSLSKIAPDTAGSTSMGQALQLAWKWINDYAKYARIILFSDGLPTDMTKEAMLDMAKQNSNIPVDTVGIGSGSYSYDPTFLRMLSHITGGVFQQAGSVAQLVDTVKLLSPEARPLLGKVKE